MGYPLSQTLFTSVHIERLLWPEPKKLSEARFDRAGSAATRSPSLILDVFQPYCIGLIKCCDLVLSLITSEHYYEVLILHFHTTPFANNIVQEEDFATQLYNRSLLHDVSVEEVLVTLQNACIWLQDSNLPSSLKAALKARLKLRQSLLGLFEASTLGERSSIQVLDESLANISLAESSATLGRPTTNEAFTLKIQRRLASSVPPRPMVAIERPKAFAFLRQLITDTVMAFQLLDITYSGDLLVAYQTFMAQSSQPAVYVRALIQNFLTVKNAVLGQYPVREFISQDIRFLVGQSVPWLDNRGGSDNTATNPRFKLYSEVDSFLDRCGHSFLNIFRTACLNRCRVRRTLCHAALEWDQIQADAEELDAFAQSVFHEEPASYPPGEEMTFSYCLSSWVYHHKLLQLRTIAQMGFELSIYAPHEFASMYWYLSFISSTHLSHLERISFFVSAKPPSEPSSQHDVQKTLRNLYKHFTWLKATEALAKALHRVLIVLQRHDHLTAPKPAYASDLLRYELRMRPFMHLSVPEPIGLDVAKELSALRHLSDRTILQQASQLNQVARKAWEEVLREKWNSQPLARTAEVATSTDNSNGAMRDMIVEREWSKDVQNAMRACIGASIAISTLDKALRDGQITAMKVEIPPVGHRDRWHASWPVPKISG